jgi:hypothetical protein
MLERFKLASEKHTRNKITSFGNMVIRDIFKSFYVVKVKLYPS